MMRRSLPSANGFRANSRTGRDAGVSTPATGLPENAAAAIEALAAGRATLVWRQIVADSDTPVGAARRLMARGRGDFLLESVEGGEVRGRYSLLGLDPDLVFRARGTRAEINCAWKLAPEVFEPLEGDALSALRTLAAACRIDPVPAGLPPALAFLVGYLGYETIGLVENLPRAPESPLDLPDMLFVRPTVLLVFDRLSDALYAIAPIWQADDPEGAVARAGERIDAVLSQLAQPAPAGGTDALPESLPELAPVIAPEDYKAMVRAAKDYILAGDIFQVVLAQRFTCPFPLPPLALYRALRRVNPSPFLYFLDLPGFALVGSSPEILVRVRPDAHGRSEVTIRPIAGTRPRGATRDADLANEASLLADPKERAEHLMLLDLGRNDVGRVAAAGSVRVTDSFTIERYSHVMHIVSNVEGVLRPGLDNMDVLRATFPAGTLTGAPKVHAMELIDRLEPTKRGIYGGAVGYLSYAGDMDLAIAIRTGVVHDGTLYVQAAAGVVADSVPALEWQETEHKARALLRAAELVEEGRV